MAIWGNLYNSLPRQGYNPGYGAREFQGLKSRLTTRLNREHIVGEEELVPGLSGYSGGNHREGSAMVSVQDGLEGASPRADYRINSLASAHIGRVNMDLQERPSALEINGVAGTSTAALRYKIISVIGDIGAGAEVLTILDVDTLMDLTFDQAINGTKTFNEHVLVPDVASELETAQDVDTLDPVPATDEDFLNPLNIGQGRAIIKTARDMNIFNAGDSYNDIETVDGIDYTKQTISVQNIYAQNMFGVAWG